MKLKSADVIGLFGSFSHHIDMSDEGLTFIHSLNGMGKSTTMKMICDLYRGNLQSLSDNQFEKMILAFDNDVTISVVHDDELRIFMETKEQTKELIESDLRVMFSVTYLSPERNVMEMPDGKLLPSIDVISSGFRSFLEAANDDALKPYAGERQCMSDAEFLEWCADIDEQLREMDSIYIHPNIPQDIVFPPKAPNYSDSKKKYEDLAYSIQSWIDKYRSLYESTTMFIDIINSLFTEKRLIITNKDQLTTVIKKETGSISIPLNRLSAGEKQLMIIFYRIIFRADVGSLVILDEPEISLHISWQQKLGPILLDICRKKDLQMLIATHSPMIIHDRWDLATELRSERA